jgi:hypothetical protein
MKPRDICISIAIVIWILSSILRSYFIGSLHDSRLGGLVALVGMVPPLLCIGIVFLITPSNTIYGRVLNVLGGLFFILIGCVFGWASARVVLGIVS